MNSLLTPPTPTAALALEVLQKWSSPALVNHCLRSWAWAQRLAETMSLDHDPELLFVAAILHDLGVAPHFDALEVPFEDAGGAVAWSFAAGAGWAPDRRRRVEEVIQRHMMRSVDPLEDAEGFLLEAATSLDVSGGGSERWDVEFIRAVGLELPRLDFAASFAASMHMQALRKPRSEAARFDGGGGAARGEAFWVQTLSVPGGTMAS